MANFHSRSNSLPSQSHPAMEFVENHLCRLKSSQGASTSTSSVRTDLASLKDLIEGINDLIQMPSFQQALSRERSECWINELLEGSLRLVDLCGFSRDIVYSTKESLQDLESSIRRNKAETTKAVDLNVYAASRKKIIKMVKMFKKVKSFNQNYTVIPDNDCEVKAIGTVLKETESHGFSVLKSVLTVLSGERERSSRRRWSLLSKFTQTSRVYSDVEQESRDEDLCCLNFHKSGKIMDLKQLKSTEMMIHEVEEGLEALFRRLIKTRVSLLNALCH